MGMEVKEGMKVEVGIKIEEGVVEDPTSTYG